ncbi:MAG: leucyl aminopeptidase family protein, partial [Pseudomonadota bacterium]
MTDLTDVIQPDRGQPAQAIRLISQATYNDFLGSLGAGQRAQLAAQKFDGTPGSIGIVPDGDSFFAVGGVADP